MMIFPRLVRAHQKLLNMLDMYIKLRIGHVKLPVDASSFRQMFDLQLYNNLEYTHYTSYLSDEAAFFEALVGLL